MKKVEHLTSTLSIGLEASVQLERPGGGAGELRSERRACAEQQRNSSRLLQGAQRRPKPQRWHFRSRKVSSICMRWA
jgi:hypothetical protein